MNIAQVMLITGASHATVYRWVSERGFPKPTNGQWDEGEVRAWWAQNRDRVGRWPKVRCD